LYIVVPPEVPTKEKVQIEFQRNFDNIAPIEFSTYSNKKKETISTLFQQVVYEKTKTFFEFTAPLEQGMICFKIFDQSKILLGRTFINVGKCTIASLFILFEEKFPIGWQVIVPSEVYWTIKLRSFYNSFCLFS
jgi:hypothetical protein